MQTFIALFRGINVGGKNLLPMKALVANVEKCMAVPTTGRNLNTVNKLLGMIEGL